MLLWIGVLCFVKYTRKLHICVINGFLVEIKFSKKKRKHFGNICIMDIRRGTRYGPPMVKLGKVY